MAARDSNRAVAVPSDGVEGVFTVGTFLGNPSFSNPRRACPREARMSGSSTVAFVFPHQLFADHPILQEAPDKVFLVEDSLFFGDAAHPIRFHKQKLALHRASMSAWRESVLGEAFDCELVAWDGAARGEEEGTKAAGGGEVGRPSRIDALCARVAGEGAGRVVVTDVHDFLLDRRLRAATKRHGLSLRVLPSPMFLNDPLDNRDWRAESKRWFMADFYRWQRRRHDVLMAGDEPVGGRWSFDEENRRKLPKGERERLPELPEVRRTAHVRTAIESVEREFPDNPGNLDDWYYPVTHGVAERWLDAFLVERFVKFGPYEDAIAGGENWLYHGVLTPMLNVGLLTPGQILRRALAHAADNDVPIESVEGFVRQIIGWREFMRATYDDLSVPMRTTNHWGHTRALPSSFWSAETGIDPVDDAIRRVRDTGYCHHIERLMILGGFMFLCEIDPDDVYAWFMEMFVDSYDWVMVPNVYAMSQHADGGAITTKPYFSGSSYVRRMSDWKRGAWCEVWDGLFWRWIHLHRESLAGNPRWAMMVRNVERMDKSKLDAHLAAADGYLASLDG